VRACVCARLCVFFRGANSIMWCIMITIITCLCSRLRFYAGADVGHAGTDIGGGLARSSSGISI